MRTSPPSSSPSTRPTCTRPRRRSSSWPTPSSRTSPRRRATCPAYRSWLDTAGLRAGLPLPAPDAPAAPVAEAAARRAAAAVACLKTPAHLGYLDTLLAEFPDAHLVHTAPRPGRRRSRRAPVLNTTLWRTARDDVDPARGRPAVARADGLDLRPRDGHPRPHAGAAHRSPTSLRATRVADPIGALASGPRRRRASTLTDEAERGDARRGSRRTASARRSPTTATRPATSASPPTQIRERFADVRRALPAALRRPTDARLRARASGRHRRAARARAGRARAGRAPDRGGRRTRRSSEPAGCEKEQSAPMRGLLRLGVRGGHVLGRGLVVEPGPAAPEGHLHHPARARGRRPPHPGHALGHRQPRLDLPGDPDLGRRALRDPRARRRAPDDRELLHALGRAAWAPSTSARRPRPA